ncbi:hypothetical protein OG749_27625 [Streptomyces nojiriensis]|uniref:hypothetical protein n=1 Tax=Streptomyces nojiriensis TaxID=66374 RepID=UPI002E1728B0
MPYRRTSPPRHLARADGVGLIAFAFPAWALTAATRDAVDRRRRRRNRPPEPAADLNSWGPLPSA